MKNNITSFLFLLFLLNVCLYSCKDKTQNSKKSEKIIKPKLKEEDPIPSELKSPLRPNEKIELRKIYTDTVKYLEFNDGGDERMFIVEKNKKTIGLVYNNEQKNKLVRGDEIVINWKMDSIRYAGDDEFLDFTQFLISSEKIKSIQLRDKKIKFLWRETHYDSALETDINSIMLNEDYIKNISEPEKAALAYVATFIGNECEWDGNPNESRSNLKCKILWALDLRYQCSDRHLDYLRFWFRSNEKILKEFENCRTKPDGATIQNTFDEINLEVNDNKIIVSFKASGINLREGESWNWTEKQFFEFKENELILTKKEVSPIERETFELGEN